jgi:hypothetical protein
MNYLDLLRVVFAAVFAGVILYGLIRLLMSREFPPLMPEDTG